MKKLAHILIATYQKYSASRPPRCKFYPSCSNYAATAISRYGLKGLFMSASRLLRCHPWSHGGVDYVDADIDSADARDKKLKPGHISDVQHISFLQNISDVQREGAH